MTVPGSNRLPDSDFPLPQDDQEFPPRSAAFYWLVYSIVGISFLTGGLLWWGTRAEEIPRPEWVVTVRIIHGCFNTLIALLLGFLLATHVSIQWSRKTHRPSGVGVILVLSWLLATGLGLLYLGGETSRVWASRLHNWGAVAGLIFFCWHGITARSVRTTETPHPPLL